MTDQEFLDHLRAAERYIDQYPGPRGMRDACEHLDRRLRGRCQDRTQRDALHRICCSLHDGSARQLDETIDALQTHLRRIDSPRQHEKMIRFAQAYGADSATIHRLKQDEISAMMAMSTAGPFANIAKQACTKLAAMLTETIPVNQQTIDNAQVTLDKAIADKAKADAAAAKADHLGYLAKLANATTHLIASIQGASIAPRSEFVTFRKELQPLAAELGYRIVFVGDRTTAALVQA